MANTSQSHPLIVNQVTIPDAGGGIGLTFCPGKKGDSMYSGRWDRDLMVDLPAIRDFGATALVTLMESQVRLPQGSADRTCGKGEGIWA